MDCFNNTCLSCDRECENHYCSQACKLADVERGSQASPPSSPTSSKPAHLNSWQTANRKSTYQLEPAFDSRTKVASTPRGHAFHSDWESARDNVPERVLTPSSSRSSLSSNASSSSASHVISAHDTQHLQDYFNSLDKARAAKRRSSTR